MAQTPGSFASNQGRVPSSAIFGYPHLRPLIDFSSKPLEAKISRYRLRVSFLPSAAGGAPAQAREPVLGPGTVSGRGAGEAAALLVELPARGGLIPARMYADWVAPGVEVEFYVFLHSLRLAEITPVIGRKHLTDAIFKIRFLKKNTWAETCLAQW